MIEFVCGRAGSGKSEYTAKKIRAALTAAGDPLTGGRSKKIYLIVPEQQAVVWESRAARTFPPQAALSLRRRNRLPSCVILSEGRSPKPKDLASAENCVLYTRAARKRRISGHPCVAK